MFNIMPRNTLTNNQRSLINPYIYEAEPIDYYSMLSKGFAQQEERRQNAIQQHSAIKQALGKAREQLHQDPDTLMWFDQKANDIEKTINDAAQVGDYAGALNAGLTAAGDLANDASLNARIRSNTQYKEEFERQRQRVGKGISQATFDWWVKNNPYHYEDIKDKNGVIIGGNDWQSNFTPVDDINVDEFIFKAFKLCTPRKPLSGNYRTTKSDGTTTSETYEYVSEDAIINNLSEIFAMETNAEAAFKQRYEVEKDKYNKLKEEYQNDPTNEDLKTQFERQQNIMGKNAGTVDFKTFCARMLGKSAITNNLAYSYRTKSEDLESTEQKSKNSLKGQGKYEEVSDDSNVPTTGTKGDARKETKHSTNPGHSNVGKQ